MKKENRETIIVSNKHERFAVVIDAKRKAEIVKSYKEQGYKVY